MEESSVLKGKRTKRKRHHLLPPVVSYVLSLTTSAEISDSPTEEEDDMANCLILLAGGGHNPKPNKIEEAATTMNITRWRFAEPATTTTTGKAGNNAHQCRDCHRCFPSHQALGGHRASHNKKPKLSIPLTSEVMNVNSIQLTINSFSLLTTNKIEIHRCVICSNEYSSGQALGGHMRKHRSSTTPEPTKEENSKRFYLDLNLPPPWDDFEDNDAR